MPRLQGLIFDLDGTLVDCTAHPLRAYPQCQETLESYHKAGIKMGLCTNMPEQSALRITEEAGLRRFLDFIAGGNTFPFHKPHPAHVKGVVEALNLTPADCVMVGDSTNDVLSAHGAGMKCIGISHGYGQGRERLGADLLIGGFSELGGALGRLGFQL